MPFYFYDIALFIILIIVLAALIILANKKKLNLKNTYHKI